MLLTLRVDKALGKISDKFIKTLSTISVGVAVAGFIPFSDAFILFPLQIIEVSIIAYLGGREFDFDLVKEFIIALGGVGLLGYGLRFAAQQLVKVVLPVVSAPISGAIAFSGTFAISKTAQAHFIDEISGDDLKKIVRDVQNEAKGIYDSTQ